MLNQSKCLMFPIKATMLEIVIIPIEICEIVGFIGDMYALLVIINIEPIVVAKIIPIKLL